ncbi:MAG: hypothetical protein ACT452_21265 [Microthrixaceae bacterium]
MNKRSIVMTAAVIVAGLVAGIGPAQAKNTRHSATDVPPPITVRGGYINDLSCVPTDVGPLGVAQEYDVECTATTLWNGDFTGRTVAHIHRTVAASGRMSGTYEEMFVGTYAGDKSYGGLLTKGYLEVDENAQFFARAEIVSGTCAWAGSTGSMSFDGFGVNGGYVGQWNRPAVTPAVDPTCDPLGGFDPFGGITQ